MIAVYLFIALLDSISWVDPASEANALTSGRARTIIDRIFRPETFKEASYSAPLASVAFYGGQPLLHPGAHALGTDLLGRDVVYRTLKGMRVALLIGGLTSLVVIPIALLFGVTAGYFGRRIDDAVFFAMTVLASVPSLLLLIALIMVLGKGTVQVCVALGVTGWVHFCRIARGETLKLREADFVAAARALGVRDGTIIRRHILPNIAHLVIITFALSFTALVLSETILSYLGIGLDGSWGQMIDQARNELSRTPIIWWNLAGASVALFTLVLCGQHDRRRHARHHRSAHAQGGAMSAPLLAVEGLSISFPGEGGHVRVVDRVSLSVAAGETLALVGESGCGKSMTALAIMRLIPKPGRIEPGGRIQFEGRDLLSLSVPDMRAIRGARIGMIFQEPMTSLNPVTTVGDQVMEAIELHADISRDEARGRVIELFGLVGIPDPKSRFVAYPHQLSGGLKQRVHDRHGHGDAAAPADRRRADDRARCHHPRADPGAAARSFRQDGHRGAADHARLRRGQRGGRPGGGHVRGPDRGGGHARGAAEPAAPPLHAGPLAVDPEGGGAGAPARGDQGHGSAPGPLAVGLPLPHALPVRVRPLPHRGAGAHARVADAGRLLPSRGTGGAAMTVLSADALLEIRCLRTWFPIRSGVLQRVSGHVRAVDGVDLTIFPGETLALVGESGCGKTTVGRAILQLVEPTGGNIWFRGVELTSLSADAFHPYRRQIQIVMQDPGSALDPRFTVRDAIAEGMDAFAIGADYRGAHGARGRASCAASASTPPPCGATRTSSPAASASASASPGRSPSTPLC